MTGLANQSRRFFLSGRYITRAKYLKIQEMAATVNFSEEYQYMNKVASKLAHPTAFSVLAHSDEGELRHLKPLLFKSGVRFGMEAFNEIREYVNKKRSLANPIKIDTLFFSPVKFR
jgi:hypothetical protein